MGSDPSDFVVTPDADADLVSQKDHFFLLVVRFLAGDSVLISETSDFILSANPSQYKTRRRFFKSWVARSTWSGSPWNHFDAKRSAFPCNQGSAARSSGS